MLEVECPYCSHTHKLELNPNEGGHDYANDEAHVTHKLDCEKCGLWFSFATELVLEVYVYPQGCNGKREDCSYEVVYKSKNATTSRCSQCGKIHTQGLVEEER